MQLVRLQSVAALLVAVSGAVHGGIGPTRLGWLAGTPASDHDPSGRPGGIVTGAPVPHARRVRDGRRALEARTRDRRTG